MAVLVDAVNVALGQVARAARVAPAVIGRSGHSVRNERWPGARRSIGRYALVIMPIALPARPAEAHALDIARVLLAADDRSAASMRVICTTAGRGQAAFELAEAHPTAEVTVWFLDLFPQAAAVAAWESPPPGLRAVCAADMPPGPYHLAVVPLSKNGEAELSRDILQSAFLQLAIGGRLVASIDNAHDNWLREQLAETGETVRVRPAAAGDTVAYIVEKTRELTKIRDFSCEFVFRDRDRLLTAVTRPGVFAHRRIDPGARHLLNAVDVAADTRVVDIGCGSGCVAMGLAARDKSVHVHAFDAAARAVECTRRGAAMNGLDNLTVALECEGNVPEPGSYDLALANPPYYADFRIAELFVEAAYRALAPEGTLLIVTKQPTWYLENLPLLWQGVAREEVKNYHIIEAVRA
jgi:16S rRNA (guanine1207-N2)-methyltransferase